jgi:hypothetical protein
MPGMQGAGDIQARWLTCRIMTYNWYFPWCSVLQVMSSCKLPPLLDVEGPRYKQMQAALMTMAEPSEWGAAGVCVCVGGAEGNGVRAEE